MLPLAILVTGQPVPPALQSRGTFDAYVRQTIGPAWSGPWLVLDAQRPFTLSPEAAAGIIITGSPASVTERAPWMLRLEAALRRTVELRTPVLGLCFGHQLLAQALGGEVRANPSGPELGASELTLLAEDELIVAPSSTRSPLVNMAHEDSVVHLPAGARVLARTPMEPHAAVRFAPNAWGVQFHPEFDGEIMHHYIQDRVARTRGASDTVAAPHPEVDTPWAAEILPRFASMAWR